MRYRFPTVPVAASVAVFLAIQRYGEQYGTHSFAEVSLDTTRFAKWKPL